MSTENEKQIANYEKLLANDKEKLESTKRDYENSRVELTNIQTKCFMLNQAYMRAQQNFNTTTKALMVLKDAEGSTGEV